MARYYNLLFLHTEKSFRNLIKSTRNKIIFTIFWLIWNQTAVSSVPNQSENGKHNQISGWFNKTSERFLCDIILPRWNGKYQRICSTIPAQEFFIIPRMIGYFLFLIIFIPNMIANINSNMIFISMIPWNNSSTFHEWLETFYFWWFLFQTWLVFHVPMIPRNNSRNNSSTFHEWLDTWLVGMLSIWLLGWGNLDWLSAIILYAYEIFHVQYFMIVQIFHEIFYAYNLSCMNAYIL